MNYNNIATRVAQRFEIKPEIIAILWIGSSSFGIGDTYADIDLRLITGKKSNNKMMGQFIEENIKIEVDELPLEWLIDNNDPDGEKYWIRKTSVILYDKNNSIISIFKQANEEYKKNIDHLIWRLYKAIFNRYEIEKCLKRNQKATACMYYYKTLDSLTKFLFVINNKPIPPFKWRMRYLNEMKIYDTNKLAKLIPVPDHPEHGLDRLKTIEEEMRRLMTIKGYDREKILEPWR